MVGAVVEEVPRLLVGQQDPAAGGQRDAAGILPRDAPGAIQRQHRARRVRALPAASCLSSASGTASAPSSGSANASRRPTSSCRSCVPDSVAQFDPQRLGQLDQQRGGHGALVVLDQVEIAGGNAKPGGQRLLRQAPFGAQAPHRAADQGAGHSLQPLQNPAPAVNPTTPLRRRC